MVDWSEVHDVGSDASGDFMTGPPQPIISTTLVTFAADDPGGWRPVLDRARLFDEAGIDRLVVSDHVVFGEHLEAYGRARGRRLGRRQAADRARRPLARAAHHARRSSPAMTSRIRLGTNILLAALRRPVVLAKSAATLDVLSGGRLDLGVGVGWQREEYEAAGLDFDGRGRLLDHTLEVCQTLWREQRADYDSPELTFEKIHMMPKPAPARRRADLGQRHASTRGWPDVSPRFGSGWIPWGPTPPTSVGAIAADAQALADGRPRPVRARGRRVAAARPATDDGTLDVARHHGRRCPRSSRPASPTSGLGFAVPDDRAAALDHLHGVALAFRRAVGRSDET